MRGHPLSYPLWITIGALAICLAWAPFGDSEQVWMLATVALIIACYSGFRFLRAFGPVRAVRGVVPAGRVRQQYRLQSRSWLELDAADGKRWLPVYFDPILVTLPRGTAEFGRRIEVLVADPAETHEPVEGASPESLAANRESCTDAGTFVRLRVYPCGPLRNSEPVGRLIDNPSRPAPDGYERAATAAHPRRRLLLDAQSTVVAPILGLLWIATAGGGFPAFAGATTVAAATAVWFAAIRGFDPS